MNRQDLEWLLAFAKSHSLMKEPLSAVLSLLYKEVEEYYEDEDMIDDFWIDADDDFI